MLPSDLPPLPSSTASSAAPPKSRKSLTALLRDFDTPGVIPLSARIDRSLTFQSRRPWKIWDPWQYPVFAARKARDIVSHYTWGPRRRTWGIEMTVISSLMRDVSRHSSLADVASVRMAVGLAGLVPLPADALVTPVTFRVRPRNLRGILRALDSKETGHRELSGEWIVGKTLWQTMQSDHLSTNKPAHDDAAPEQSINCDKVSFKSPLRVILYVHGGAYYTSSAAAQRMISIPLSKYTDSRVFAIDYRLAPETKFPGSLHDVVSAYMRLTEDLQVPPENVVLAGDSAGGGLCLALLLYLRDNEYSLPGGAILFSPWVDLTLSCASWETNAAYDIVPLPGPGAHLHPVVMYLGEGLEQYVTHPYVSPLFGNFRGLPPLLIQCGEAEVLRDEIRLLAHKISLADVYVQLEVYEDAVHVFQSFPFLDLAHEAFSSCLDFVRYRLPSPQEFPNNLCEARIGDDIDNDNIRVVRGDGVETCAGRRDVQEQINHEVDDAEPELSSWTSSFHDTVVRIPDAAIVDRKPGIANCPSSLRRIKSTISVLVTDTSLVAKSEGPLSKTSPNCKTRSCTNTTLFMEP